MYPHQHEALIGHNPREPRGELGLSLVLIQMLKRFQQRDLHLIFGIAVVSQKETSQIHTSLPVTPNQFPKRSLITAAGHSYQFAIRSFENSFRCVRHFCAPLFDWLD